MVKVLFAQGLKFTAQMVLGAITFHILYITKHLFICLYPVSDIFYLAITVPRIVIQIQLLQCSIGVENLSWEGLEVITTQINGRHTLQILKDGIG